MIEAAHGAGFDIVCAAVGYGGNFETKRALFSDIWKRAWDERWTIPNPEHLAPDGAIGRFGPGFVVLDIANSDQMKRIVTDSPAKAIQPLMNSGSSILNSGEMR